MSAVCTSANERNICCNSGRFTNFENRAFDRREDPSGLISMLCTTSPKEAAHASKWLMPRSSSNAGARYRFNVYISTIVLLMGVPVANTRPRPGCPASR
jgi:hypothetical protein